MHPMLYVFNHFMRTTWLVGPYEFHLHNAKQYRICFLTCTLLWMFPHVGYLYSITTKQARQERPATLIVL
jgi:hypothetical protein